MSEEARMASSDLDAISHYLEHLKQMISDQSELEDWVKAKINIAKENLNTVFNYLNHENPQNDSEKNADEYTIEKSEELFEFLDFLKENQEINGVLTEAQHGGRTVKLNKPMRGDVKKFKVYVKDPKTGNVKKVNFGDPNMRIKKSNPKRRKSFRARHHCDTNPGPKTKARYWSCRKW
jgi:hypothetical protein